MIKRIANTVSVALLIALFIFPCRFLTRSTDEINARAETALNAVLHDDWNTALEEVQRMHDQLDRDRSILHLFLHHEAVEGLEAAVGGCLRLVQVQDKPQSVLELEFIITRAEHLKSIENFAFSVLI
ncbi:MAG: DUF4363 family protein [Bacillota bacterium]